LCTGQAELEVRLDKQHKNVTSLVEQQTQNLRELEAQLAAVEARIRRAGGGGPRAHTTRVRQPKFDGATSWAVFHRQFETLAVQNNWMPNEKAAHLLSVLQGKAADIFHTVPAKATYDIVEPLQDRFGDHQLAAAYQSQLKASVQKSDEMLHLRGDVERWDQQCDTCAARQGPRTRSRGRCSNKKLGSPQKGIVEERLQPTLWSDCMTSTTLPASTWKWPATG
jgi:hypothetical protein